MTCGIYKLYFNDGSVYVGQSKDCEMRWQQHAKNIQENKATKAMMRAGMFFQAEILQECHEDWLDILEAQFINLESQPIVNINIPKYEYLSYQDVFPYVGTGLVSLSCSLSELKDQLFKQKLETHNLEINLNYVLEQRTQEEILAAGETLVNTLQETIELLDQEVGELRTKLAYYSLPWYKRWLQ